MEIIYIIIGIAILFFIFKGRKKKKLDSEINSDNVGINKSSETEFPDRSDSINFFEKIIAKSIDNGDLETANLNFAKLVESLRQQNINDNSNSSKKDLEETKILYADFRKKYSLEYPEQFLSPAERKKAQSKYDNEYLLLTTLNYNELPKSILKHIDKIKTVEEWKELNFSPKKEQYGNRWKSIKRQNSYFDFKKINPNSSNYQNAFNTEKRITKNPYYISALIEQGCDIDEFLHGGEDILLFNQALEKQDNNDFESALALAKQALTLNNQKDYSELVSDLEARLGNTDTISEKFKKYEYDIDSPIHTGEIFDWFRGLLDKKEFSKIQDYIEQTNQILDNLSKGIIEPKIYGKQDSEWYKYKKEDFQKNILSFTKGFDFSTIEPTEEVISLLTIISGLYAGKSTKPLEDIADILGSWGQKNESLTIYKNCLRMIKSDNKPRVKTRLENKIEKMN
ncbi:MAG: hypothetical protein RBR87_12935 [Bacteroidales bacterium]|jgi:hypothetical protein|nr:hypothetical protein [Bacteroidales bacterium]